MDISGASCVVYCVPAGRATNGEANLNVAGTFASQEQVQYPVSQKAPETPAAPGDEHCAGSSSHNAPASEQGGAAAPAGTVVPPKTVYRTPILMARVRPGSDALRNEGVIGRNLRRLWTSTGDSCFLSCCGLWKYSHPQLCPGDDMTRRLLGNRWGSEVVGLYPHVYGEWALGQKGFELWFLELEAESYNHPDVPQGRC